MGNAKTTCGATGQLPDIVEKTYGVYPHLPSFSCDYNADDYSEWVEQSNGDPLPAPLALYIQEFACSNDQTTVPVSERLEALARELRLQGELFDDDRPLQQLVLTCSPVRSWSDTQLQRLLEVIRDSFPIHEAGLANGCACVGSATPASDRLQLLSELGFNKVRFALLDRTNIGRTLDGLAASIDTARQYGFRQIAIDLPVSVLRFLDSPGSMESWLQQVQPNRVRLTDMEAETGAVYSRMLLELGYGNVGLDWYLKEDDLLVKARRDGELHWSLLGYTDMPSPDVIGVGPGAISSIGEFYSVNEAAWPAYQSMLQQGRLPIVRGIELEADDVLRREVMVMILTGFRVRIAAIEAKWGIRFGRFFAREIRQLEAMENDGLIEWQADEIRVRATGRSDLTAICRVFDHRVNELRVASPVPVNNAHQSSLK